MKVSYYYEPPVYEKQVCLLGWCLKLPLTEHQEFNALYRLEYKISGCKTLHRSLYYYVNDITC